MIKTIKDFNVKGKKVLVRCDFNIPLDERGKVVDDFRIARVIPTIEHLVKQEAKVILMAHLGSPGGEFKKEFSLSPVQDKLVEYLDMSVTKARDCVGLEIEEWVEEMQPGEILLLENLRFHPGEEGNDLNFVQSLARLGDIYINDAFGAAHRSHASVVGLPKLLPAGIGFLFEQEIKVLSKIVNQPERPLIGIIGGAKVISKTKPIASFLDKTDFLLLGGKVVDTILRAKGISPGRPLPDPEVMKAVEKFNLAHPRLRYPVDVVVAPDEKGEIYTRVCGPGDARKEEMILDIGRETVGVFSQIIKGAKTIFWSGPLGKIEEKKFSMGTLGVARAIIKSGAFSVVGGRETVAFLKKSNLVDRFSHVSTGGGAMLAYLSEGTLPAIEALE